MSKVTKNKKYASDVDKILFVIIIKMDGYRKQASGTL